jgi:Ran GTPase-activating protein (RanGAP) involved in mRNA processing and transport
MQEEHHLHAPLLPLQEQQQEEGEVQVVELLQSYSSTHTRKLSWKGFLQSHSNDLNTIISVKVIDTNINEGLPEFIKILEQKSNIKNVDFSHCTVDEDLLINFSKHLSEFSLISLSLIDMKLTEESCRALATGLQSSSIKKLDVSDNPQMGDDGFIAITSALTESGIEALAASSCGIMSKGAQAIGDILLHYETSLRSLNLSKNQLGNGVISIANAIKQIRIQTLKLCLVGMSGKAFGALCDSLSLSTTIEVLHVALNPLCNTSLTQLIDAMKKNKSIRKIVLCGCGIDDESVRYLAQAIKSSSTIDTLDLRLNRAITDAGLKTLKTASEKHRTLRSVHIAGVSGSAVVMREFQQAIAALQSDRAKALTTFCSIYMVTRLGSKSALLCLPSDLLRPIAAMLG